MKFKAKIRGDTGKELVPVDDASADTEVLEAATYVGAAWTQTVEALIETGRRLLQVRERFKDERGKWSRLVGRDRWQGQGLLPFSNTHCARLMTVAENASRLLPHVDRLPSDSYTLAELVKLSDERFDQLLIEGRIAPGMRRTEASNETRLERIARDQTRVMALSPRVGKFRALVIDPPWHYADGAVPYATLTQDQLLEVPVPGWADDNCHLYVWFTNAFGRDAHELAEAWGFQTKTILTWVKTRLGRGEYFRNTTEHILFCVRGHMLTRTTTLPTHFEAPVGEHSAKPDAFYDLVRQASWPPFGEVYQRQGRPDFMNCYVAPEGDA